MRPELTCWAKTLPDGSPGISVRDHCLNVGCVAEALLAQVLAPVARLLPRGTASLAAAHDLGKITLGFQAKCPRWLVDAGLVTEATNQNWAGLAVSDHALVSQAFLQDHWKSSNPSPRLWAVAIGAHHGRPKGRSVRLNPPEVRAPWAAERRLQLLREIEAAFGPLPTHPPLAELAPYHTDLWLLAGLVAVADWIGSNEAFFPPDRGLPLAEARDRAATAVRRIGWPGGTLRQTGFSEAFATVDRPAYLPNALQEAAVEAASAPGIIVIEGPMGCGKTEAALAAAQRLISDGHNRGLFFALPTQVTSNRIHERVGRFLRATLADSAQFRLAHAAAWLDDDFDLRIEPASPRGADEDRQEAVAHVREGRSWFASPKHGLLAPYGVGTVDQALQAIVAVKHFFVRQFALAGKVVILDEVHAYDLYTGTLISALIRELRALQCTVIVLSATLTEARRNELLAAAGASRFPASNAYPLVTWMTRSSDPGQIAPPWPDHREVALRAGQLAENEVAEELIRRAGAGQHVLWIRNTVIEAQQAFRLVCSSLREGHGPVGLLHGRFPFHRRAELESEWLDRLGRHRPDTDQGSILIATQVVEQSVDIDLDFMVSDLAPTDLLLQRLGRLWRHPRARRASSPEFWVRVPVLEPAADARSLKRALGRSGRVYAPYVMIRTAEVLAGRSRVVLPDDLRPWIESTYDSTARTEAEGMRQLRAELEKERAELAARAEAVTRVLALPMLPDEEGTLTRRAGAPTAPVVLVRTISGLSGSSFQITGLDGTRATISDREWRLAPARKLHQWLVRVPRWMLPASPTTPDWLSLHIPGTPACGEVRSDGRVAFDGVDSAILYDPRLGIHAERPSAPTPQWTDDDEFDA